MKNSPPPLEEKKPYLIDDDFEEKVFRSIPDDVKLNII